jgi:hypothetical protein
MLYTAPVRQIRSGQLASKQRAFKSPQFLNPNSVVYAYSTVVSWSLSFNTFKWSVGYVFCRIQ